MTAGLDWCTVPGGPFTMGSDPARAYPPDDDETPRRVVRVAPFHLARIPVTVGQYRAYLAATGREGAPPGDDAVPVTYVTLDDARAFCGWAGVRLPAEAEWETAARGGDDRLWPWGDEPPDDSRAVFAAGIGRPRPAGRLERGASAQGVLDLAGNVQEWVDGPYTAGPDDGRAVVRGGAFIHGANELRCSHREVAHPGARDHYIGFRVAATAAEPRLAFDWAAIPGGDVPIGRDPVSPGGPALADELPAHTVDVPAFELSATPVTNAVYARFVAEAGAEPPPHWAGGRPPAGLGDHPVTFVDWFAARACCAWAGGRLPTEAEWEKAARGTDGRIYPWGSDEDATRAAVGLGLKRGATRPVDRNPAGASPYGVLELAGNVWEWVSTAYAPYPYDAADGREDARAAAERVLRGGSYASASLTAARCAARSRSDPSRRQSHIGFRVARSPG